MILVVDYGSNKVSEIVNCLKKCNVDSLIKKENEFDSTLNAKGIILSGAPILLTKVDSKEYIHKFSFFLNARVPVLGICFGHQLLGLMHGSHVYLGEPVRKEIGIKVEQQDVLFDGLPNEFLMTEDHTEGITLPSDFIHLASSAKYPNEAMKHRTKPFYGVQFHPEVSGQNGLQLFQNFCKLATK